MTLKILEIAEVISKGQTNSKWFFQAKVSSKKQTKVKTPERHFKSNWPLVVIHSEKTSKKLFLKHGKFIESRCLFDGEKDFSKSSLMTSHFHEKFCMKLHTYVIWTRAKKCCQVPVTLLSKLKTRSTLSFSNVVSRYILTRLQKDILTFTCCCCYYVFGSRLSNEGAFFSVKLKLLKQKKSTFVW